MAEQYTYGDHLRWHLTGASALDGYQPDPAASIGAYRSAVEFEPWAVQRVNPIPNVAILSVHHASTGVGKLVALDADTLQFTAPGDTEGASVAIADGETKILVSADDDSWIRVKRLSDSDLQGTEYLTLTEMVDNLWDEVASAEAVAGDTEYRCLSISNQGANSITSMTVWLGSCDDTIGIVGEAPSSDAATTIADEDTSPGAWTWNTGTTSGTGETIPTITAGNFYYLWVRRIIAASTAPSYLNRWALNYQYTADGTTYTGTIQGGYRVARSDYEGWGIWVGQDEEPDIEDTPDETFTSRPHTTTLTLTAGHTYYIRERNRNVYGLWSAGSTLTVIPVDAAGAEDNRAPSAPEDLQVSSNADGTVQLTGLYFPAPDGTHRADLWVIWEGTTAPDPDADTPDDYQSMEARGRSGVEYLSYASTNSGLPDTPIYAIARVRRIVPDTTEAQDTDTAQLGASGAGTLGTSGTYSGWGASGYAEVMTAGGLRREVIQYSSRTDSALTVDAAGRGLWHTEASAGAEDDYVQPIEWVDSANTTVVSGTSESASPALPKGDLFFGRSHAVQQFYDYTSGDQNIYSQPFTNQIKWTHAPGSVSLYVGTMLVWRCIYNSESESTARFCIPSDWQIDCTTAISGSPVGSGVAYESAQADGIDPDAAWATGTDLFYLLVGSTRRAAVDADDKTFKCASLNIPSDDIPDVFVEAFSHKRYEKTTFQVWDPTRLNYYSYAMLDSDGVFHVRVPLDMSKTQAEIEAL